MNTAGRKVTRQDFEDGSEDLAEVVADLEERSFPVKRCKCCK